MSIEMPAADRTTPNHEAQFKIDFIDPLFAVAIHIGFAEGLLQEHWLHNRSVPHGPGDFANLFLFIAAFWTIVASWLGYHKSIQSKPIIGQMRFVLDIGLLALYILLLLYFRNSLAITILMAAVYVLYIAWDFYKTKEYPAIYYGSQQPPMGLVYLGKCLGEWISPGRHEMLRGEAVTAGWAVFFGILIPFAFFPFANTDNGKFCFAFILIITNSIYRYDKGSRGTWICSVPFKILMGAMVAYLILYHTNVLHFGQ